MKKLIKKVNSLEQTVLGKNNEILKVRKLNRLLKDRISFLESKAYKKVKL